MFTMCTRPLAPHRGPLLLGLTALSLLWCLGCAPAAYQGSEEAPSYSDDVEYLSEYGMWSNLPPYGMVWRPYVVSDWEPFYYGHWAWTDEGWAWVSYEPFGWLVFHYGYWGYERSTGWYWVPGEAWSPAQVQWYTFGDYAAWAPLPPPGVFWPAPWEPYETPIWIVIDDYRFMDENVGRRRIREPIERDIIRREPIFNRPPDITRVETLRKRTVPVVKIRKEPTDMRKATQAPEDQAQEVKELKLRKMVLPDDETRKVRKYAPRVEREVLAPKREAPTPQQPEQQQEEKKKEQQPEKKADTEKKTRTRSR